MNLANLLRLSCFALVGCTVFLSAQETSSPSGSAISGVIFEDKNKDGLMAETEEGWGGTIVDLLDSEAKFIARVVTAADGTYRFPGLAPGIYFLRFEFSPGFGVRSKGIQLGENDVIFTPVPLITPESRYSFTRLNLSNPSGFMGEEVSAFTP